MREFGAKFEDTVDVSPEIAEYEQFAEAFINNPRNQSG
jgi:hypothetical protein